MEYFPLNDIRHPRANVHRNLHGIGVVDFLIECTKYANVKRWEILFGDDD